MPKGVVVPNKQEENSRWSPCYYSWAGLLGSLDCTVGPELPKEF